MNNANKMLSKNTDTKESIAFALSTKIDRNKSMELKVRLAVTFGRV